MSDVKVAAVVVTYNRLFHLKNTIDSLVSQTYTLDYIVIVDNSSNDGTKEYLEEISKQFTSIVIL